MWNAAGEEGAVVSARDTRDSRREGTHQASLQAFTTALTTIPSVSSFDRKLCLVKLTSSQ